MGIDSIWENEAWRKEAACLDKHDLFIPSPSPNSDRMVWSGAKRADMVNKAKAICDGCEVKNECFETLSVYRPEFGVWAGLDMGRAGVRRKAIRESRVAKEQRLEKKLLREKIRTQR